MQIYNLMFDFFPHDQSPEGFVVMYDRASKNDQAGVGFRFWIPEKIGEFPAAAYMINYLDDLKTL